MVPSRPIMRVNLEGGIVRRLIGAGETGCTWHERHCCACTQRGNRHSGTVGTDTETAHGVRTQVSQTLAGARRTDAGKRLLKSECLEFIPYFLYAVETIEQL